jgi:hypothetical protein
MSYHYTSFGWFGRNRLRHVADLDGFVPQCGDRKEDFRFDRCVEFSALEWEAYCKRADEVTRECEADVRAWMDVP